MTEARPPQRPSLPQTPDLITDPAARAEREIRNALRQFDLAMDMVDTFVDGQRPFRLRVSHILALHRAALEGISPYAGNFRPGGVEILGSSLKPVGAHLVPAQVEEFCDHIAETWDAPPLYTAAFAMWRLSWIHPFADGNGRTSRMLSYMLLCIRLGGRLPGTPTIPEQIAEDRTAYFAALDAADAVWAMHQMVDVSGMETLLDQLLTIQLQGQVTDRITDRPGG